MYIPPMAEVRVRPMTEESPVVTPRQPRPVAMESVPRRGTRDAPHPANMPAFSKLRPGSRRGSDLSIPGKINEEILI